MDGVYAICTKCGVRRDKSSENGAECVDKTAHKKFVGWVADVQFKRTTKRLRKTYTVAKHDKPQALAQTQARQWRTDYERGQLDLNTDLPKLLYETVAVEWRDRALALGQFKKSWHRSEKYNFQHFIDLFKNKLISDVTLDDIENWQLNRRKNGIAIGTINRELKNVKWVLDYALKKGYIKTTPFIDVKTIKGANIHDRWMTEQEAQLLINSAIKLNDTNLVDDIIIGLNTGFRKANLERLETRHIGNNIITAYQTKSGKPYSVPIPPAIVPILKRRVALRPTGRILDTTKLDRRFRAAAKLAGLYIKKGDMQNVTIHTLRHTFAAWYLLRGGDIYMLSLLLGHSSVAITQKHYGHLCRTRLDAQAPLMSTSFMTSQTSLDREYGSQVSESHI